MILSIDANFRLSNKINKSTNETDPCLTDGRAYVANTEDLRRYTDFADKIKTEKVRGAIAAGDRRGR